MIYWSSHELRKTSGRTVCVLTHGKTNKFVYWMKNGIKFDHYLFLRSLCSILILYTFLNLNDQISVKQENYILTYQISLLMWISSHIGYRDEICNPGRGVLTLKRVTGITGGNRSSFTASSAAPHDPFSAFFSSTRPYFKHKIWEPIKGCSKCLNLVNL